MKIVLLLLCIVAIVGCDSTELVFYKNQNEMLKKEILTKDSISTYMLETSFKSFTALSCKENSRARLFEQRNNIDIGLNDTIGIWDHGNVFFRKRKGVFTLYYPECYCQNSANGGINKHAMSKAQKKGIVVDLDSISSREMDALLTNYNGQDSLLIENYLHHEWDYALQYWRTMKNFQCFVKPMFGDKSIMYNQPLIDLDNYLKQYVSSEECPEWIVSISIKAIPTSKK